MRLTEYYAVHHAVSPDGKWIVCIGQTGGKRELWVLPFEGGQPSKKFDFAPEFSRLQWTPDSQALIYRTVLNGTTVLAKQALGGGQPQPIASLGDDRVFDFGYSLDGKLLAVIRDNWQHDLVLISELKRLQL